MADEVDDCRDAINCQVFNCGNAKDTEVFLCAGSVGGGEDFSCSLQGEAKIVGNDANLCRRLEVSVCHTGRVRTEISSANRDIVTVRSGEHAWSSGVLEVGSSGSGAFDKSFERIRCKDDLTMGQGYVSLRNGRNLDLFWFVGVTDSGLIPLFVRLQDGMHHGVAHTARGPLIKLGRNKDVFIQYCFDGNRWTSSNVERSGERYDYNCNNDAIVFFNVDSIAFDPPRPVVKPPERTCGYGGEVVGANGLGYAKCCDGLCPNNFGICGGCGSDKRFQKSPIESIIE